MQTRQPPLFPHCRPFSAAVLALIALAPHIPADEAPTGEQIFRTKCASCHGMSGEGVKGHYAKPLSRRPFRGPARPPDRRDHAQGRPRNLRRRRRRQGRGLRPRRLLLQNGRRPDRAVAADRSPAPERRRRPHRQFPLPRQAGTTSAACTANTSATATSAIAPWNASTPNALRLQDEQPRRRRSSRRSSPSAGKVRSSPRRPATTNLSSRPRTASGSGSTTRTRPLIDGWVRSGVGVEQRGTIRLLAGRAYPLRLEFFKSKEAKEKTASIALEWKPPTGVAGPIPPADLSPNRFPETLVISAAFPPDDRSLGWERGNTRFQGLGPGRHGRGRRNGRLRHRPSARAVRRGERRRGSRAETARVLPAFRRTGLPPAAHRRAKTSVHRPPVRRGPEPGHGRQARGAAGPAVAALLVPRGRRAAPTPTTRPAGSPSRLWDSPPDQELLDAAAGGRLTTREQVAAQAERMLNDQPRPRQAPRVPAPVAADRPRPGRGQGRRPLPRLRPGRRRRPADFARPVPGRRDLERRFGLPPAAAGRRSVHERPAGEVLRRRPAGRRAVPEGQAEPAAAGRRAHPSLPDGGLRPHVGDIADPPRRLSGARRPRPDAAAAAGGVHRRCRRAPTPT